MIAHLLAHNFGSRHAPCRERGEWREDIDPDYPHAGGKIGAWGYDFRSGELLPPSTSDVMSLCGGWWISDYHFTNMLAHRQSDHLPPLDGETVVSGNTLLLWGGLDANGDLFLNPTFVSGAPPSLPRAAGEYELTGRTGEGEELFSLSFAMPAVAGSGGRSSFVFALPVKPEWAEELASVAFSGRGKSVELARNEGGPAAVILRNPLTGQVRGFLRHLPPDVADKTVARARASGLEALVSRGIPPAAEWRF